MASICLRLHVLVCCTVAVCTLGGCRTERSLSVSWGKPRLIATDVVAPWQLAPEPPAKGKVVLRLRAFALRLGKSDPLIKTDVLTFGLPVRVQCGEITGFHNVVRGYIDKSKETRVLMIAAGGGGKAVYCEYQAGWEVHCHHILWDFTTGRPPGFPQSEYTLEIFVIVQRSSNQSPAIVSLDSVEIEAKSDRVEGSECR